MYTIFLKRERKMFVICPKCAAKYQIPAEIALKEGQKVQCSACQHVFHFEKKQITEQNESVFDIPKIPEDPILKETEVVIKTEKVIYIATIDEEVDKKATEENRQAIIEKREAARYQEVLTKWQKDDGWKVNDSVVEKIDFHNILTSKDPNKKDTTKTETTETTESK